jgi:hypothetical protein
MHLNWFVLTPSILGLIGYGGVAAGMEVEDNRTLAVT